MTKAMRWPNHAEWARIESIERMEDVVIKCKKLRVLVPNTSMKMALMDIQMAANETITALTKAKNPGTTPNSSS